MKDNNHIGRKAALVAAALAAILLCAMLAGCTSRRAPEIKKDPNSDSYLVTVYGKEGSGLVFVNSDGIRTEVTIPAKKYVTFKVPASSLLPNEPLEDNVCEVTPTVYRVGKDGTETLIDNMGSIMIDVPSIMVSLDDGDQLVSEDGSITISGRVDPATALVTVGGEQAEVAENGSFTHTVKFEDTGEHTLNINAEQPGHSTYRHTVRVDVKTAYPTESLIQMPWEYGDTEYSQRVKSVVDIIEVRGKVPVGSALTASSESTNATITTPLVDDEGNFSFSVGMAALGDYVIDLLCTSPSGQISQRSIHVQRAPEMSSYVMGAWRMNYASFSYSGTQGYQIGGTVIEILKNDDYILAVLRLEDNNTLVLEYHNHYASAGTLEVGKTYSRIYGRPMGLNEEGRPQAYVWFIND